MNSTAEPTGPLDTALAHATRLLQSNPALAAEQAVEILKVAPHHPLAMLLLGVARRLTGDVRAALQLLEPLAATSGLEAPLPRSMSPLARRSGGQN